LTLGAVEQDNQVLKSAVVLFPFLENSAHHILKDARKQVKNIYLENELTLGEFYPNNPDTSVHNNEFHIAQSPYPMFVIRDGRKKIQGCFSTWKNDINLAEISLPLSLTYRGELVFTRIGSIWNNK